MLGLYHHSTSVCAAKVRLALAEKRLEWRGHYVDIMAGEQFRPEYLKLNPKAVVPTLVDNAAVIRESTVINEYLDDAYPEPPLRPADPAARAQMRLWTKAVDEGLHMANGAITFVNLHRYTILKMSPGDAETYLGKTRDPLWRERKREWVLKGIEAPDVRDAIKLFDKTFSDLERTLENQGWLAGDQYSLADIALTPYVNRIEMLGLAGMFGQRPHLTGWFERIQARPSFRPAVIDWIPETTANVMKTNGAANWPRLSRIL